MQPFCTKSTPGGSKITLILTFRVRHSRVNVVTAGLLGNSSAGIVRRSSATTKRLGVSAVEWQRSSQDSHFLR